MDPARWAIDPRLVITVSRPNPQDFIEAYLGSPGWRYSSICRFLTRAFCAYGNTHVLGSLRMLCLALSPLSECVWSIRAKMYGGSRMVLVVVCLVAGSVSATQKLQERYSWQQLDFVFPNQRLKQQALARGDYVPTNGLPVGIERWENKLFVSVPRWKDGIPSTLNYIDMNQTPSGSPALIPYPDWSSNVAGDCANGLSTVYRIKADKCGRLWALDTGTVGIGNTTQQLCPYALNIWDLKTNRRLRRYELRADDTNANTFIANIAIDMGRSCDDTYAYMSDELGYGLIVYSFEQNKSWRFAHSFFFPDPLRGDFNVAGLNFQWGEEGIFGMSLT
uniref:Protein yellow n=1 Tax=Anopheles maculatus TaxID=74869 RepID=A0A182SQV6_9DIPT